MRSGRPLGDQSERLGAGAGDVDVVAARAQERADGALDRDLIVDEQDTGARRHAHGTRLGSRVLTARERRS